MEGVGNLVLILPKSKFVMISDLKVIRTIVIPPKTVNTVERKEWPREAAFGTPRSSSVSVDQPQPQ